MDKDDDLHIKIPPKLKAKLRREAEKSNRGNMTLQLIRILEERYGN